MGLGRFGFFEKGENWNTWRKTFQTKEEDHQQAESKNSVIARPLTQATLVEGKCDHLNQPSLLLQLLIWCAASLRILVDWHKAVSC